MKPYIISLTVVGVLVPSGWCEGIIGYDGKEHHWHPHRDGMHDSQLRATEHHRRHSLSHPRLRHWDHHVPHMLNQAHRMGPLITGERGLHIATNSRRIKRIGSAVSAQPETVASAMGNATQDETMHLSRIEKDLIDSVYGNEQAAGQKGELHTETRGQAVHFRKSRKKAYTEQEAAEDLTAQEVQRQRKNRARLVKIVGVPGGAPAAAGPAPAPGPMGSPAASPAGAMNSAFHMDEDLGAAEQGFQGDTVEHDNMKTMTKDWRGEYGGGKHDFMTICAQYPDNQWCRDRGYHRPTQPPKSASVRSSGSGYIFAALVVGCMATTFCMWSL